MIDLGVVEALLEPRASARRRDRQPLIVCYDLTVGIGGIDPDIVVVTTGRLKAGESVSSTATGLNNICQCGTFQRVKEAILALPTIA